jgi:uncharacterized OB-fold protein
MIEVPARPAQIPTELSRPYWEGAAAGRLMIQRCTGCGKLRHYPRLLCDACHSDAVEWVEASRRGSIHSWTVSHHAFHPAFKAELPYTLVTVDLEEGVRALGRWTGDTPVIGQKVAGYFAPRTDGVDLVFAPKTA